MYVIYCLQNKSLKENIVNVSLAESMIELNQIVKLFNTAFLPTPYTVFLTKTVSNHDCIDLVYSLLCKFGKHLSGTFFEISLDFIIELFDLIYDELVYEIIEEKYRIIQCGTEYIIPKAQDIPTYNVASIIEPQYDHLNKNRNYTDIDL
jgi:hypothetical protein